MNWLILKNQVRRILRDTTPTKYRWQEEDLLDYAAWTLDALCSHTAIATATSFTLDNITTQFILPDNLYESIDRSGLVYADDGTTKAYLVPVKYNYITKANSGYYVNGIGNRTLNIISPKTVNGTLNVKYFAVYPHPLVDEDELQTPNWATAAIVFRMASYALDPFAGRRANIAQWNTRDDSGRPTDNPLAEQSQIFYEAWLKELSNYPIQQRENYFIP